MTMFLAHLRWDLRLVAVMVALLAVVSSACDSSQRSAGGATVARSSATSPFGPQSYVPIATVQVASASLSPTVEAAVETKPAAPGRDVRAPSLWLADLAWSAKERLAHAKSSKGEEVQRLFDEAGVTFPPHDVLYRAFKHEDEFEVWAGDKDQPMKLIATWGICAASGELGPKRAEGDLQVPEGYYKVGYFHPMSSYYLSALVDYPNASDRKRGGPNPGGQILIHGRCASIGCLSMTDERIEEIYLIGWGAFMNGRPTHIHIFPARDFAPLYADEERAKHHDFWREIEPGYVAFEKTHRLPEVRIAKDGQYVIEEGPAPAAAPPAAQSRD